MHILFLPSVEFQPQREPLAGIFVKQQALALKNAGHQVGVISVRQFLSFPMIVKVLLLSIVGRKPINLLATYSTRKLLLTAFNKIFSIKKFISYDLIDEIPVMRIEAFYFLPPNERTNHWGWLQAGKTAFREYVSKYGKPDILHAHNAKYGGWLAVQLSKKYGIPVVITEHSSFVGREIETAFVMKKTGDVYQQANAVIAVSPFLAKRIQQIYPAKNLRIHYVPNVLGSLLENAPWPVKKPVSDEIVFLIIASLIPVKGYPFLLKAFAKAFGNLPQVKLHIGGIGTDAAMLKKLAAELGIADRIKWLGLLGREQVMKAIDNCDVFVLSSVFETFGVVLIEALSRGKPAVATRCGGPEVIINSSNGWLCNTEDENSLAEALVAAKNNYKNFDPRSLRTNCFENYHSLKIAEQLTVIYSGLMKRKPAFSPVPYRQCAISVMDTIADPDIFFDEKGICNYYYEYKQAETNNIVTGEAGRKELERIAAEIKEAGKEKKYDCIMGLSGGVDSTYVAWLAKQLGLRPLAVHFDNGWDSELAVNNIANVVNKLGFDLFTYVINWNEFKDLQLSYLKASVVDIEAITDHAIIASLYRLAGEKNIKYILSGTNVRTEQTLPRNWIHAKTDHINIQSIHKAYGSIPLKTFPFMNAKVKRYYQEVKNVRTVSVLNYIDYNKKKVKDQITRELGWRDYGGKHYESIWTRFYQGYILPQKFHIDKRKAHLSDLIFGGQITKEEAIAELKNPPCTPEQFKTDYDYILKKLGVTDAEFQEIMKLPPRSHYDFDYEKPIEERYPLLGPVKKIYRTFFPQKF